MSMNDIISSLFDVLIKVILAAVPLALTGYLFPWLAAHTNEKQKAEITRVVDLLVQTAEQTFGPGTGPQKLAAVQQWLDAKGIKVETGDIEAAVLRLHAAGNDWVTAHAQHVDNIPSTRLPAPAQAAKDVQAAKDAAT
jgi:hypothetical protein